MSLDEGWLSAIDGVYAAATDAALWPEAMRRLMTLTGTQAATFCVIDDGDDDAPRMPTFVQVNFDPAFIDDYLAHMAPFDPTVRHILDNPRQRMVADGALLTEAEKDRHPYYDWHGRSSDTRHRVAGMMSPAPGLRSGVTLHRSRAAGEFSAADLERLDHVFRHVERALAIGFRLGTLGAVERLSLGLLERSAAAVFLIDGRGRVVFVNAAGHALADAGDGFVLGPRGLSLRRASDDRRLRTLVAAALSGDALPDGTRGGVMPALRPSGRRPYVIQVAALPPDARALAPHPAAACVIVTDPEAAALPSAAVLRRLYGLTPAEAGLALRLAAGEDLHEAAAGQGVTYGTARGTLGIVFRKTGTHRQGELVRLLLTALPVPLSPP